MSRVERRRPAVAENPPVPQSLRVSLGECIRLAIWTGLALGGAELVLFATKKLVLGKVQLLSPHALWMSPLANIGILSAAAVGLWLVGRVVPRLGSRRALLFTLLLLSGLGLQLQYRKIHEVAMLVLAAGVASELSRLLASRPKVIDRLAGKGLLEAPMVLVMLSVIVFSAGGAAERRSLAATPSPPPGSPDVILITLDTQRASSTSAYGYGRPTTPFLEQFGREGIVFEKAMSTSSWTLPSHGSMFTGRYPTELNAAALTPLDDTHPTLAEALTEHGYLTGGFVANLLYCAPELGLARGFTHYQAHRLDLGELASSSMLGRRILNSSVLRSLVGKFDIVARKPAAEVTGEFLGWLDGDVGDRPYFAFLNYYEAHDPYLPPDSVAERFGIDGTERDFSGAFYWSREATVLDRKGHSERALRAERNAYDAALAHLDQQLRVLMEELEARGRLDRTAIIITSDHGEHFGEQVSSEGVPLYLHGNSLHTQLTWVPLMVRYPAAVAPGLRFEPAVTLRDLPRTILDLVGADPERAIPGSSMAWSWGAGEPPAHPSPVLAHSTGGHHSIVEGGFHYIRTPDGEELYDLAKDMPEEHNLAHTGIGLERLPHLRESLDRALGMTAH